MADNNDLKVVVGLNLPKSVLEIKKDLVKLADELAGSDDGKLKIVGQLDLGATEKKIKAQLSSLKIDSSALKITPTIDTSSASQLGNQITKQLDTATQKVDFSAIAKNLRKAFNINDNASIKEATENIKAMYEAFNVDPEKYKAAFNKLIGWYEQRSKDFVYTERQKVDELNNLMLELYNQPELHTKLPGLGKASKDNPLLVTKGTLEEMKSLLGSMQEVYKLFGSIRVDDKHGALIGSFGEDWDPKEYNNALGVYIQYLQKIQELRKASRFQPTDVMPQSEYESIIKLTEQSILEQLNLVNANNKVIQSNEKVAQSERDVTEAQKELNNAKKSVNTDKGNDEELKKLTRSTDLLMKMTKQYELIKYYQEQQRQSEAGTDEWEYYNKAWQEEKQRLDVTKQVAQAEGLVTEEYKKQTAEAMKRIDEKYAQLKNAKNIVNNNGGNYLSNNQIQDVFASLNEAEKYFKNFNLGTVTSSLAKGQLQGLKDFVIELKSATGEVEKFRYAVENIGDDQNPQLVYKLTDIKAANAGIQRLTESTQKYYASMEATIITAQASAQKLKATWSDTNGGKSVKDTEHLDSLKQKYAELMAMIEGLRGQSELEAKQTIADIKAKEKEINSLIGTYHNAEKVATDLRTKGYETVKEITGTKINTFEEKIKGALGSTEQLSAEMTNLRTKFESLNSATTQAEKSTILTSILDDLDKAKAKLENLKEVKKNFDDASKSVNKVISDLDTMSRTQIFNTHSNNAGVVEFQDKIRNLSDSAKQVKTDLNALGDSKAIPPELKTKVEELKQKFDELNGSNKTLQANLRQNDGWAKTERQIQTLTARIKEYMAVNTKAAKKYSSNFDGLLSGLSQAEINKDSEAVRRLSADFQILQHEIKAAGDQGKTLFERIKADVSKFTGWLSITTVVSTGVREIRKMVQEVVKLDNSLLELSKVSDLTANGIKKVTERAFELSKQVGKTGTDVIDATTNFKRAGFELEESINLAEKALVLTNVAEGIDDAGEAATALISIMKGYGDTSTDFAQKILDAVNEVSNTQAIDFDSLIDGSQRLAAVAKQGSMSFEQMLGVLTGTNEVLQNIEKTSSGAITIFTRLQSVQLPDEEDVLPLAKLQETFNKNTNGMVNIIDQTTGELRNVYDILNDISEVWDTLDKNTQEGLAFAAAGTRQKNVFLSMMENWDNVKRSVESATNSMGSATEENQKYLDSISGRLSIVESNFQSLSNTVINSDLVKFLVSGAGGALGLLDNIISKFGTLQTLLPIIMGSLSAIRNVGQAKKLGLYEYADCNVVVTRNELMIA